MYKINSVDKIRVGGRGTTTVVRHKYSIRIFIRHHGGGPTTHSIDGISYFEHSSVFICICTDYHILCIFMFADKVII